MRTGGTRLLVSHTPDSTPTGGAHAADGVTNGVTSHGPVADADVGPDASPEVGPPAVIAHDERHEGTSFAPVPRDVPRDAAATTRPYPPEADPEPDVVVPEVAVPGEQTDPDRRAEVFPEDEPTAVEPTD